MNNIEVVGNTEHKIIHSDAIIALNEEIADESIDLIFADPPYNIGKDFAGCKDKWETDEAYLEWCYEWLNLCVKKLKPSGAFYVMTSTQFMPYFDIFLRKKLTILSRLVWAYDSSGVQAKRYFGSMYEPILFCVKDKNNYTFKAVIDRTKGKPIMDKAGNKLFTISKSKDYDSLDNDQIVLWSIPVGIYTDVKYTITGSVTEVAKGINGKWLLDKFYTAPTLIRLLRKT